MMKDIKQAFYAVIVDPMEILCASGLDQAGQMENHIGIFNKPAQGLIIFKVAIYPDDIFCFRLGTTGQSPDLKPLHDELMDQMFADKSGCSGDCCYFGHLGLNYQFTGKILFSCLYTA